MNVIKGLWSSIINWIEKHPQATVAATAIFAAIAACSSQDLGAEIFRYLTSTTSNSADCSQANCLPKTLLAEGLLAYYPFNGNTKDESGHYRDAIGKGAITLVNDRFGNPESAYRFDGNEITLAEIDTRFIPPEDEYSISLWYLTFPTEHTNEGIFSTFDGSWNYYGVYYSMDDQELIWSDGNERTEIDLTEGVWVHLVITKDTQGLRVYKNHNLVANQQDAMTTHAATLVLGNSRYNGMYFSGIIDDVRIYNRPLSAVEIGELYSEGEWKGN